MKLAKHHMDREVRFVGLDIEANMIAKAKKRQNEIMKTAVDFEVADIIEFEFETADLIVCYYIAFISPAVRQQIVKKILMLSIGEAHLFCMKKYAALMRDFKTILREHIMNINSVRVMILLRFLQKLVV